jgi:hypothetical protein
VNAGVLHGLGVGAQKIGVFAYDDADEQNYLDGLSYVNIHTSAFPGGEIRGQKPLVASFLRLAGNAPNPFGPRTTIRFELERGATVSLTIYDAAGRFVRALIDAPMAAGSHGVSWDATDSEGRAVANGVYHYVLETPAGRLADRMTLVR